ncbi:hydrogenase maturation protease [Desulfocapsa sp. AH-315-G09]|uniref:Hydrogenase maturation protease n=1 Tax=Desulfotalea psychrophila TaxID=84980 RepID=A0ABS3ATL1_9BACT|nr:hydrogenase maturation protease [Desulfocapsa sp.]MBN4065244.1 hydrogenase maturation protease [Desulfocapsa sp. AH-315-G09]MBN4068059.1 hydrogenase maturation protease [Desulfotalea psychrophila]
MTKQCAVIGIGNTLLGDEGVGVHIVERLQRNYRFAPEIALIDGGCAGLNLYFILERYDPVIIIDALALHAGTPGSLHIISGDELTGKETDGCSAHSVGIGDVLLLLRSLAALPKDMVLVGIVPDSLDFGFRLSPIISGQVQPMEDIILQQLHFRNIEVTKR